MDKKLLETEVTPALYPLKQFNYHFNVYFVIVIILCVICEHVLLPSLARSPLCMPTHCYILTTQAN